MVRVKSPPGGVPPRVLFGTPRGFKKQLERRIEDRCRILIIADDDALEERLVHQPADAIRSIDVGGVCVVEELQRLLELRLHLHVLDVGGRELLFDSFQLPADPVLLAPQEIEWDRTRVVRLKELRALIEQLALPAAQAVTFSDLLLPQSCYLLEDRLFCF